MNNGERQLLEALNSYADKLDTRNADAIPQRIARDTAQALFQAFHKILETNNSDVPGRILLQTAKNLDEIRDSLK